MENQSLAVEGKFSSREGLFLRVSRTLLPPHPPHDTRMRRLVLQNNKGSALKFNIKTDIFSIWLCGRNGKAKVNFSTAGMALVRINHCARQAGAESQFPLSQTFHLRESGSCVGSGKHGSNSWLNTVGRIQCKRRSAVGHVLLPVPPEAHLEACGMQTPGPSPAPRH